MAVMQHTIARKVQFRGVGLHSGAAVRLTIMPAPANHGIVFRRSDLNNALIPARWDNVTPSQLCTLLVNEDGVSVSTVEHVMAALAGVGINNAVIEVDGAEVPILDGSSAPFVKAILEVGLRAQLDGKLRAIRVLKPVEVRKGEAFARLSPADQFEMHFDIDFTDAAIGHQEKQLEMVNGAFVEELMDSRTFCRLSDVEQMQQSGLALGGTFMNAVVIDGDRILSPGGLRHQDEAVRHKMLDAVGDLALAGAPLLARYTGHRAGHAMTNALLRALFAQPDAWEWADPGQAQLRHLPGVHTIAVPSHAQQLAVA